MTSQIAIGLTTPDVLDTPTRCPEADSLRGRWYAGDSAAGDELRYHTPHCLRCLRRHAWDTERSRGAVHPERTIEEIEEA